MTCLKWFGWTDRGRVRSNNEDAFLGVRFDGEGGVHLGRIGDACLGHEDFVFAVSDGMGGAKAGEFASKIATEKIMRRLPPAYRQGAVGVDAGFGDVLTELFSDVHRALIFLGDSYEECAGMGATLSLCWFTPGWLYLAHIGDSRIYYLPAAGGLRQLTHDDTHVGWLYRNGKISEREARNHRGKNALQKALGAGHQFVDPQLGAVGYEIGDRFLLCSDGVVDGLFDAQIESALMHPDPDSNPAQKLVEAAVESSGRDNTTALVIEVCG
ncbi:MAG: PP2C family protein-serine/threonine phosphatase [Chthoniobacterales bacterium]